MRASDINSLESESGVVASLIHNPELAFHSEELLPNHFSNRENQLIYCAIVDLARRGIKTIDAYNILEDLNASESTRRMAGELSVEKLQELIDMSDVIARNSVEEYKLLVFNVMDAAFRRDAFQKLGECQAMCADRSQKNIEQRIYAAIDGVMTEYSTAESIPEYKDVVDDCWSEIVARGKNGAAGIPFKFKLLNEYATIEPGELFIFAAGAKQGKSMMLLNCAMDLLKQGYAVLYLDSELNSRLFTARVLSNLTGIEFRRLTTGNYSKEEAEDIAAKINWIKTRKFTHIYIPFFDEQSIFTAVKKVKHTQGLDVLIVDYFKSSDEGDAFESYQELGRFTNLVKNKLCGDMGICGLGAVQTTLTGKIADSAKISRNASTIAILEDKTPDEVEADGAKCGNKKLRVVLNRNGMQMAQDEYIDMYFDGNKCLYEEAPQQHIPLVPY